MPGVSRVERLCTRACLQPCRKSANYARVSHRIGKKMGAPFFSQFHREKGGKARTQPEVPLTIDKLRAPSFRFLFVERVGKLESHPAFNLSPETCPCATLNPIL